MGTGVELGTGAGQKIPDDLVQNVLENPEEKHICCF